MKPKTVEQISEHLGGRPALIRMEAVCASYDPKPYQVADGIALIHVCGVLSNGDWGDTTYESIQHQVKTALADTLVRGILFRFNSPGGSTDDCFETGDLIAKATKQKPCWAAVDTMCFSAAFLLASQTEKIYVAPKSGGVGSVGVFCAHFDYSRMLQSMGVNVTLVSAGKGKTDGNPYEPLSPAARKDLQSQVDRLYGEFVGYVSRGRHMDAAGIVKIGAHCFDGADDAIASGYADAAGDLETGMG